MVKLICGTHNHALAKSFVGHPYVGWLIVVIVVSFGCCRLWIKAIIVPKNAFPLSSSSSTRPHRCAISSVVASIWCQRHFSSASHAFRCEVKNEGVCGGSEWRRRQWRWWMRLGFGVEGVWNMRLLWEEALMECNLNDEEENKKWGGGEEWRW